MTIVKEHMNCLFLSPSSREDKGRKGFSYWVSIANEIRERMGLDEVCYKDVYFQKGFFGFRSFLKGVADKYDVIFFVVGSQFVFDFRIFEKMKQINNKLRIVILVADDAHYYPIYTVALIDHVDLVIVIDTPVTVARYKEMGKNALFLPGLFSKDTFFPKDMDKDIDVSFVGRKICDRFEIMQFLDANGIKVYKYGRGFGEELSLAKMVDIYNRSKINLNFSKAFPKYTIPESYSVPRQFKGRIFQIALCGGFCLTEYIEGIEDVFKPDKEIACFRTAQELKDKIRYYLTHEKERKRIAYNAYRKAIDKYELSRGVDFIVDEVQRHIPAVSRREKQREIYYFSKKGYISYHWKMLYRFLRKGALMYSFQELFFLRYGIPPLSAVRRMFYECILDMKTFKRIICRVCRRDNREGGYHI